MGQRRHHYEQAFERFLRDQRMPYICVNEAKKALLPSGAKLAFNPTRSSDEHEPLKKLKNFDFMVYGQETNLLVEVKGRRLPAIRLKDGSPAKPRMECWVTLDDIESLERWKSLFGDRFEPVFVFVYWCDDVPPDGLFVETIAHRQRWYTIRAIRLDDYKGVMKVRSPRWRTMNLSTRDFDALSRPFGGFNIPRLSSFHHGESDTKTQLSESEPSFDSKSMKEIPTHHPMGMCPVYEPVEWVQID